jgi:hypothetical protein
VALALSCSGDLQIQVVPLLVKKQLHILMENFKVKLQRRMHTSMGGIYDNVPHYLFPSALGAIFIIYQILLMSSRVFRVVKYGRISSSSSFFF